MISSTSPTGSRNHLSPLRFQTFNEKYFEIGMKLNDFSIQLVKYWYPSITFTHSFPSHFFPCNIFIVYSNINSSHESTYLYLPLLPEILSVSVVSFRQPAYHSKNREKASCLDNRRLCIKKLIQISWYWSCRGIHIYSLKSLDEYQKYICTSPLMGSKK